MRRPDADRIVQAVARTGSLRQAAVALHVPYSTLHGWIQATPGLEEKITEARRGAQAPRPSRSQGEQPRVDVRPAQGKASFTTAPAPKLGDLDTLMRERGLDPADWEITNATLNEWDAPVSGGGTQKMRQLKVNLRRKIALQLLSPGRSIPALSRAKAKRDARKPKLIVVEGDHQVPYHDPKLHRASIEFLGLVKPDGHVFLGDTLDFPTISRHPDHPAAMATPQECVDQGTRLLRDKREATPDDCWAVKIRGNHDDRLAQEQLNRAERTHGLAPGAWDEEEQVDAFSLRRLLHLDRLGVRYGIDPRGWQHDEVVLVPGPEGLVVRHGLVTGANTAGRTLRKLGRSVIVGHDHSKETAWWLDPSVDSLRQAVVAGTMSRNDEVFPHFTVKPDWHQGFVTATIWPDGRFIIEHAHYFAGALYWRSERIAA